MATISHAAEQAAAEEGFTPAGLIPLDSLPFEAARLDRDGVVIASNSAWRSFSKQEAEPPASWLGRLRSANPELRNRVLDGLDRVLRGERERFVLDYAGGPENFRLTMVRLPPGALIFHEKSGE